MEQAGFEEIGGDGDVTGTFFETFLDGANAVTDVQPDVPDQTDQLFQPAAELRVCGGVQQEQQVHVGTWEQLPAAIAAHRDKRSAVGQLKDLPELDEHLIHQLAAPLENRLGERMGFIGGTQGFGAALEAGLDSGDELAALLKAQQRG